jgi:hypothetical protein
MKAYFSEVTTPIRDNHNNKDCSYFMNISEKEKELQNGEKVVEYEADEYLINVPYSKLTSNDVVKAVIDTLFPVDKEQKLINEYNAANLGLYEEKTKNAKVVAYNDFLAQREAIKTQINKDCITLGVI